LIPEQHVSRTRAFVVAEHHNRLRAGKAGTQKLSSRGRRATLNS
jgi:hypothetical protein